VLKKLGWTRTHRAEMEIIQRVNPPIPTRCRVARLSWNSAVSIGARLFAYGNAQRYDRLESTRSDPRAPEPIYTPSGSCRHYPTLPDARAIPRAKYRVSVQKTAVDRGIVKQFR